MDKNLLKKNVSIDIESETEETKLLSDQLDALVIKLLDHDAIINIDSVEEDDENEQENKSFSRKVNDDVSKGSSNKFQCQKNSNVSNDNGSNKIKSINNDDDDIEMTRSGALKEEIKKYFKQEITEIPLHFYENVEELNDLDLTNMSIKHIPEKLFQDSIKSFSNINFSDNEIEEIPANLFQNATKLEKIHFDHNNIKKLPDGLFANATSLNRLHFGNNEIEEIPTDLFKNATKLEKIHFDHNNIKKLPKDLFSDNQSLDWIDFSFNEIEEIPGNLFQNATKFKIIFFKGNKIKKIPNNLFANVSLLYGISFDKNEIEEIPSDLFQNATALSWISFENNKIKKLPADLFANAQSLDIIDFSDNEIEEIPANLFQNATKLEEISFKSNKIKQLTNNLFPSAEFLNRIYFSYNEIEVISNKLFQNAIQLKEIYFDNNKIKQLPDGLFTKVESLDSILFAHNEIGRLPSDLFKNANTLECIYFDNNKLKKLPQDLFANAKSLNIIIFDNNEIEEIPSDLFQNATELSWISFENNKIKKLPDDLFAHTNLNTLFFGNNQIEIDSSSKFFSNVGKITGGIYFSNNNINQFNYEYLKKFKEAHFDFRFNIDTNDISVLFKYLFNERLSDGIKRIQNEKNPNLLFNRLFILCFNKTTFRINDECLDFEQFEKNIEKLRETEEIEDEEPLIKFSILDFFVSIDKELIDSFWIILFKNFIQNMLKQKLENIEFKFYSSESLEAIFKRNYFNLIETFFKNEIDDKPDVNQFIHNPDGFYFHIDFVECFEIIFENNNEKMAIYLLKILKYIYKNFEVEYAKQSNILKIQEAFSIKLKENKNSIMKQIFENNWTNLISLILDDYKHDYDYLNLSNDNSNHILMLINESKNETFLNHEATEKLLNKQWKSYPRLIYYFHFLLYLTFVISFSLNIEYYNDENDQTTLIATTKWYSFVVILYFTIFEYLQLVDSFKKKEIFFYINSFKNLFELICFPLFITTLFLPNSELKSSFNSLNILLAYWILLMRLDKFHYLGKFVHVFGNIIRRSIPLFIIVLINLISFVLAFRNRTSYDFNDSKNNNTNHTERHHMTHFIGTFSNSLFKTLEFLVGGITTESMGLEELNSLSFINFIIYGLFIFIMTILFINIFTGISIDEIQSLIQHSEAQIQTRKINYVFKIETLNVRYFNRIYSKLKEYKKIVDFISKLFNRYHCLRSVCMAFRKSCAKIKEVAVKIIANRIIKTFIDFIKMIINFILDKFRSVFKSIKQYKKNCWQKYKNEKEKKQKEDSNNNNSNQDLDRMKNQINELKMIMQSKFESIERIMKKGNSNLEERFEKIENQDQKKGIDEILKNIQIMNQNIETRLEKIENQNQRLIKD
jgi:Leucine-rich repeat (LRR) protein